MIIQTTRFGEIEVQEEMMITFPDGILGFMDSKKYVLIDHGQDSPVRWLQAISDPDLAFVVMDPFLFKPDYNASVPPEEVAPLGAQDIRHLLLLTIITIPSGQPEQMTANLKGPIVINLENRLAKQVVLYDSVYSTRFPVYENLPQRSPNHVGMESNEIPA